MWMMTIGSAVEEITVSFSSVELRDKFRPAFELEIISCIQN